MWKTILFAHDFSPCAERVEPLVRGLAKVHGARVAVCHVTPLTHGLSPDTLIVPPGESESVTISDFALGHARARLEAITAAFEADGFQATGHAFLDDVAPGILRAAKELRADVVVMGTHGRKGLSHLLLGSVAEKVLRSAEVPVVTLRSPTESGHLPEDAVLEDESAG